MAKKHDENQDVRILSKRFKVNEAQKLIHASHSQIIGNKTWGRIDFLTHYCGYTLVWGDTFLVNQGNYSNSDKKKELRDAKKASKQHQLTNKNSKKSQKK